MIQLIGNLWFSAFCLAVQLGSTVWIVLIGWKLHCIAKASLQRGAIVDAIPHNADSPLRCAEFTMVSLEAHAKARMWWRDPLLLYPPKLRALAVNAGLGKRSPSRRPRAKV